MKETHRKPWFRLWDELLSDPKMIDMTDAQIGIWFKLLCLANQQTTRGFIILEAGQRQASDRLATLLRTRSDRLATALEQFKDRNMINFELDSNEGWISITNWNQRQPKSDDVAERVRKHREMKRYSNGQKREEKNKKEKTRAGAREGKKGDDDSEGLHRDPSSPPYRNNHTQTDVTLHKDKAYNKELTKEDLFKLAEQLQAEGDLFPGTTAKAYIEKIISQDGISNAAVYAATKITIDYCGTTWNDKTIKYLKDRLKEQNIDC
jgi:hypothetical protein